VEVLRYFLSQISPRSSILVEACQRPEVVCKFFGSQQNFYIPHLGQDLTSSSGAQLAYNFDLMGYIWASLLSGEKHFIIESLINTAEFSDNVVWVNFLRLHDELTLEMLPESVRAVIQEELIETGKGVSFRG